MEEGYSEGWQTLRVIAPTNLRSGLVTIGVPVYNGAQYLREALESLVTQDYPDLEIIISDNASDDGTEGICREYAARDHRVRYYRAEKNQGPFWNYVRVYELASGQYFMWAAHDDLRHHRYVSRCVAELERNPKALFCCTGVKFIDAEGRDVIGGGCIDLPSCRCDTTRSAASGGTVNFLVRYLLTISHTGNSGDNVGAKGLGR